MRRDGATLESEGLRPQSALRSRSRSEDPMLAGLKDGVESAVKLPADAPTSWALSCKELLAGTYRLSVDASGAADASKAP